MSIAARRVRRDLEAADARRRELAACDAALVSARQLAALQQVWRDAIVDVPYYDALVRSGRAPRELTSWNDVRSIPELTRDILHQQRAQFVRRSGPADGMATTGGSMAAPLQIGMNQSERDLMRVVKVAAWQSFGYDAQSRLFLIWGHGHLLGDGWRGRVNRVKRTLADAALGYRRVDAYRLNREICLQYAEQIAAFRPTGVIGYASALDLLARYAAPLRDRLRTAGVAFVLVTSEPPPRADSIDVLEDLFAAPVVQEYGGVDIGQVAFAPGHSAFDVYSDLNYLETTGDGSGTALLSSLYPRYTPLIRYRVGDVLDGIEALDHGHVRRFASVAGRVNDTVMLADGESIYGLAVLHCVHQEPDIHQVQVVIADEGITIDIVARAGDHAGMERRIRARLADVHPELGRAAFRYVDDVQTTAAGKRRWFVDRRSHPPRVHATAAGR